MKKIFQKLFIIALLFLPLISSADIYGIYINANSSNNSVEIGGSIGQVGDNNGNYPPILAGLVTSQQPTNNCATIVPNPRIYNIVVPEAPIYDQQGNVIVQPGALVDIPFEETVIRGFTPGTTYYYCLYATDRGVNGALTYSQVLTFKTTPKVTLTASLNKVPIGGNTVLTWTTEGAASCNASGGWSGAKNKDGGSQNISDIRVRTTFTLTCNNGLPNGNTIANILIDIDRTSETNNIGTVATLPLPGATNTAGALIQTEQLLEVTDRSALLQGRLFTSASAGDNTIPNYGYFRISKVDIPPIFCNDIFGSNMISTISNTPRANGRVLPGETFKKRITNLEPDTDYAYCAIVSNDAKSPSEIKYGQVVTFRTNPCVTCPHTTIRTLNPASVGVNTAIMQGNYNSTRHIQTWFQYKEKGLEQAPQAEPFDLTIIESSKNLAKAHIFGSSLLESVRIGANILKSKITNKANANIPEWKTTPRVDHTAFRNYGRMSFTLTGLRKDTVYQYRAVGQTILDTTRSNPNPVQTFYGNTLEFRTRIYGNDTDVLAHCYNGIQDFGETGIDVGGGCPSRTPTCFDNIQNGNETGIDEGGSCGPPRHCFNGVLDEDKGETSIDRGGPCGNAPIQRCPPGTFGTPPDCIPILGCGDGFIGTPPNCREIVNNCPRGFTGTFPNCIPNETETPCPPRFTGTFPNCVPPVRVTANITASPLFIQPGGNTSITWTSTNATACTVSGPVIGGRTGLTGGFGIPDIQNTSTWSVLCTGETGSASSSVTVFVSGTGTGGGSCPFGFVGIPPNCNASTVCPAGTTGIHPNCRIIGCPSGSTGTYPNCRFTSCPPNTICGVCPENMTGTYPNCKITSCPTGMTGTLPNCKFTPECPASYSGTYPVCTKDVTSDPPINHCTNGIQDFGETSIDRGGPCGGGGTPPHCYNGVQDFDETDIDKGGSCGTTTSTPDPVCPTGFTGNGSTCVGQPPGNCAILGTCPTPSCPTGFTGTYPICTRISTEYNPFSHCFNGIQDFGETSIDRGGGCGGVYTNNPTCFDNIQNGGETGVDEGGHCGDGPNNVVGPGNPIKPFPSCFDGIKNGSETGIDTGGHCGNINTGFTWVEFILPGYPGTGTGGGTCANGECVGTFNFNIPDYTGQIAGDWIAGNNTGSFAGNCKDGKCIGDFNGPIPNINGPINSIFTGGQGDGSNNPNYDWIEMIFPGFSGTGNLNGNCTNGICNGTWGGIMPGYNGPTLGIWSSPNGTGPFIGSCTDGKCGGTWTGVVPGNNGPNHGNWTGGNGNGSNGNENNQNWVDISFNGVDGTGTFTGNCTTNGCNGNWTGLVPGHNGPITGTWTGPNGTGTFTGTCINGVCNGTWTGGSGNVGPISGTWNGGNNNNPATMVYNNTNGTGTFNGSCTNNGCSGNWTGIIPGVTGNVSNTWAGPNGTGTFTGTCTATNGCSGTWTGGNGDIGQIYGTWNGSNGNTNEIITITLDQVDGTGTFTGNCTTRTNCNGTWTGGTGPTGPVKGTWAGPNGTGTFTGTCTATNGCSGTWTGGNGNVGPISGVWNGGKGNGNIPAKMVFQGTDGTGTFTGTCTTTNCNGNWNGILPNSNGTVAGTWTGPNGTGTFTGTCKDNVCNGTWTGGKGNVGTIYGPWDGNNKNNPATMKFDGTDGTGTFSGTCDKTTCKGTWDGLIPGHNGPINGKWKGLRGEGTFSGNCVNGVCTGTWTGGKGDEGIIYGTWDGTNGNGNGNELYLGYEGTPDVDDIVRLHEGVEHVFIRRIMINTELARRYGYKKGQNLLHFAWDLAHKFSKEFGYVDGQGREIRVNLPDVSAYQLRQVGDKLTVYEFYKNKIIDIRDTTTVFKDKNSYEYYFQKN